MANGGVGVTTGVDRDLQLRHYAGVEEAGGGITLELVQHLRVADDVHCRVQHRLVDLHLQLGAIHVVERSLDRRVFGERGDDRLIERAGQQGIDGARRLEVARLDADHLAVIADVGR